MSYTATANPTMPAEEKIEALRQEMKNYMACVKGNPARLQALTHISVDDGFHLDNMSCAQISDATLALVAQTTLALLLAGRPVDGEQGSWSVGFAGSRWMDLRGMAISSGEKVDYCRIHFYSKKHNNAKGAWPTDKPYMVKVIAEKARN